MGRRSNRYNQAVRGIDRAKLYSIEEAMDLIKGMPAGKFDESVDIAINLGVDPKHTRPFAHGAPMVTALSCAARVMGVVMVRDSGLLPPLR